jgi:chemotaxis methyl-accepting protein methylase
MTGRKIVTEWFRTPCIWPLLAERMQALTRSAVIWSGACGTGQEAYSAAILLLQHGIRGRVLATDIDRPNLDTARAGRYPREQISAEVTEGRLTVDQVARYFVRADDGTMEVHPDVQALVSFAELKLGQDAAPRCDLAMLRNVWRHLTPPTQALVADQAHRALRAGGRLVLGGGDLMRPDSSGQLVDVMPRGLADHFVKTIHPLIWRPRPR